MMADRIPVRGRIAIAKVQELGSLRMMAPVNDLDDGIG
jgi:hypothetical protein